MVGGVCRVGPDRMNAGAASPYPAGTMTPQRSVLRHVPVFLVLLAIGAIYGLVSERGALGPRGLVPGLIVALVALLLAAVRAGRLHFGRTVGLAILGS